MREMKDSGIKWIGAIPADWKVVRAKYVMDSLCKGAGITKEEVVKNGDTPCIRYGEIYSRYDNHFNECVSRTNVYKLSVLNYAKCGDLLFAATGELVEEIGKNVMYDGEVPCLVGGDIIIGKHKQNPYFLNFAMNCQSSNAQKSYGKAKLKVVHITASEIGNIWITIPPRKTQDRIACYLDSKCALIDSIIAKQDTIIEKLKEYKISVITEVVTKGLNPDVEMKDSEIEWLGMIPEHWIVYRIANLYDEFSENGNEDLPILTVSINSGISDKEISDEESDRVFVRSEDKSKYKRVRPGYLAYNMMRAWQGAFGAARVDGMVSPAYVVAAPKKEVNIDSRYIEALLRTPVATEEMHRYSHGIADFRLRLYWPEFKNIRICLPPFEEQREIADNIDRINDSIDKKICSIHKMIEKLQEYKKSLIYEVVTGKKEV